MKKIIVIAILFCSATLVYSRSDYLIDHGVVRDNITDLYWTRCSLSDGGTPSPENDCATPGGVYTWEQAIEACNHLKAIKYAGRSGWRLPNIRELQSIIVYTYIYGPRINEKVFPGTMQDGHYWSSTTHKNNADLAWTIDFSFGNVTYRYKTDGTIPGQPIYVRCVAGP
jgi:hypothetical protein